MIYDRKKILTIAILLASVNVQAQVEWNSLELASPQAKIYNQPVISPPTPLIQNFETKEGRITVYAPPLSAGITISGTVYMEPRGRSAKETTKNLAALQSYTLMLNNSPLLLQGNLFTTQLPTGQTHTAMALKNKTGKIVLSKEIPLTSPSFSGQGFSIPPYTIAGDVNIVSGNFDGNIGTTVLKLDGQQSELLAESPSLLFFKPSTGKTGPVPVECMDKGSSTAGSTHLISLHLTADQTNLARGQQTTLRIQVTGLDGLKEKVPFRIENLSPSVITLEGGNTQLQTITPYSDALNGRFVTTRKIRSQQSGGFSVQVSLIPFYRPLPQPVSQVK
jgi:hypothetical protein